MSHLSSRRVLAIGAVLTAVGLAIAGTSQGGPAADSSRGSAEQLVGGLIVLAGWALLAWGIHRLGRESSRTL